MLIVTNGDSAVAALKVAGIPGHIFPWRDVLHEGPVPITHSIEALSDIRAAFIAGRGWGPLDGVREDFRRRDQKLETARHHDELVLWFEHDLYDQLQLIQILAWLDQHPLEETDTRLICHSTFVTSVSSGQLSQWFDARAALTPLQRSLGASAWDAFRQPTPERWATLVQDDTSPLPFVGSAFERLLQELPAPGDGLSRSERQILTAVHLGHGTPLALFRATQAMEEAAFMGDASFWEVLAGLILGPAPLLVADGGFRLPDGPRPEPGFLQQPLDFTTAGGDVLAGKLDWLSLQPTDKWLGGVHLGPSTWRWEPRARQLLSS